MTSTLARMFLDHPRSVGESYAEHLAFALGFAVMLLGAGLAALIHAVLPFAFETTASRMIGTMTDKMAARHAAGPARRA